MYGPDVACVFRGEAILFCLFPASLYGSEAMRRFADVERWADVMPD